jgi:hypothetical protein
MKLEIRHLTPYFPYGLECMVSDYYNGYNGTNETKKAKLNAIWSDNSYSFFDLVESERGFEKIMPILRPLSQIKEYFEPIFETDKEVNEFLSYEATTPFSVEEILNYKFEYLPYGTCQVLLKHHFDLFGLIGEGLAVDINTLSVE